MSATRTWVVEENEEWRTLTADEEGRECSQTRCHRAAVSVFMRHAYYYGENGYRSRRWFCCDRRDHQYGRMTRYGNVWRELRECDRAEAA